MPQIGEVKRAKELGYKGKAHYIWHACEGCGKQRWVRLKRKIPEALICLLCFNRTVCRYRQSNGRYSHGGYFLVRIYSSDEFYEMARSDNYILEHRLIMAKHLNRIILPREVVHHINGDITDNRVENLQLFSNHSKHKKLHDAKDFF